MAILRWIATIVTTAATRIGLLVILVLTACASPTQPVEISTETVAETGVVLSPAPGKVATSLAQASLTKTPVSPSPTPVFALPPPPYAPGSVPVIEQPEEYQAISGDTPPDIAISPDGRFAYVAALATDTLFVIDLEKNQIIRALDLWPFANHPLGPAPANLVLTPAGDLLLVGTEHDESLLVIETASYRLVKRIPLGGVPTDILAHPTGDLAFVSVMARDTILVVIDLEDLVILRALQPHPMLNGYYALALAPDGSRLYLAGAEGGGLAVIDPQGKAIQDVIPIPAAPGRNDLEIAPDGQTAFLSVLEANHVL